jgi:hypothetical protein
MSASSVVIDFEPFEGSLSLVLPGRAVLALNQFSLERKKDALGAGVVVAVTGTTYATLQAMPVEQVC